ncbi:hypothetical protein WV31_10595 [Magnetospirillum sp. ME-1]|uniref:hypothetical protein n=1 Tax=Magnetospirillum sp. ME-1 TaxID=1639348 RepID=UPI000A17A5E0|nr:hypothetical protein [Magnetospirillum sp. ME-1]ARJ66076.1 hypothetical protein WV31_10595 [Magnetospirillum sp. ME-1]
MKKHAEIVALAALLEDKGIDDPKDAIRTAIEHFLGRDAQGNFDLLAEWGVLRADGMWFRPILDEMAEVSCIWTHGPGDALLACVVDAALMAIFPSDD